MFLPLFVHMLFRAQKKGTHTECLSEGIQITSV